MSSAARRIDVTDRATRARPPLSLVPTPPRAPRPASRRKAAAAAEARARTIFWLFAVSLASVCALGAVRVAVIVRATEMTMSEARLQKDIKEQRVEADQLEVDRSSLSTPSRIESIASQSMSMAPPRSVNYIALNSGAADASARADASGAGATGVAAVLDAVMHMSAGEAQSLLVGELGLAGSR